MLNVIKGVALRVFVFFKQKTAYDMRISDWSSDVCSSDLLGFVHLFAGAVERALYGVLHFGLGLVDGALRLGQRGVRGRAGLLFRLVERLVGLRHRPGCGVLRSEEPTSELPSLMRISYAVFCLKKKHK